MKAHKLNTLNLEIGIVSVVLSMLAGPANSASPPFVCGNAGTLCADQSDPPLCSTCQCPPGSKGGSANNSGCSTCPGGGGGWGGSLEAIGMARYWVSEPYMNLRLEDEPLGYEASRGHRVAFHLSYRQRCPAPESSSTFGVGNNWSCSFRSYIIDTGGSPDL